MDARPVGLVLARTHMLFGVEPFFVEVLAGIEEVLTTVDRPLLLQVVPDEPAERKTYRRWARDRAVAAVVLVNLVADDPRIDLVRELEMPSLALASTASHLTSPHVVDDGRHAVATAVAELVALGHRRIAQVSGPTRLLHTQERTDEFAIACEAAGATFVVAVGDYTGESGAAATRELLAARRPPTAIVFDNDVMALAGLGVARELGLDVPADLSIVAWDDSALCRLASPPLSAMAMDVHELGRVVGSCVLQILSGATVGARPAPPHQFVARGSTGPAPADDDTTPEIRTASR